MTIKKRMTLLSVLVALLGISALLIQHYALNTQENLKNGDTLLAHIQSDILMLRRHEKDFLMRNDLKYVQRFEQSFQQTQIHLNLLKQLIHDHHLPSDTLPTLITALDNYRESFTALVTATQQVGMNEKNRSARRPERGSASYRTTDQPAGQPGFPPNSRTPT